MSILDTIALGMGVLSGDARSPRTGVSNERVPEKPIRRPLDSPFAARHRNHGGQSNLRISPKNETDARRLVAGMHNDRGLAKSVEPAKAGILRDYQWPSATKTYAEYDRQQLRGGRDQGPGDGPTGDGPKTGPRSTFSDQHNIFHASEYEDFDFDLFLDDSRPHDIAIVNGSAEDDIPNLSSTSLRKREARIGDVLGTNKKHRKFCLL